MRQRLGLLLLILLLLTACGLSIDAPSTSIPSPPKSSAASSSREEEIASTLSSQVISDVDISDYNITTLNCYNGTACAITEDGKLITWGSNVFASVGNGKIDDDGNARPTPPHEHTFNDRVVAAGSLINSYAITASGDLYTWGNNTLAQCGTATSPLLSPYKVNELSNIQMVSMSTSFSLALDKNGDVYQAGVSMDQFNSSKDYEWRFFEDAIRNEQFTKLPLEFSCIKLDSSVCSYVFLSDSYEVYVQGILVGDAWQQSDDIYFPVPTKIDFPEKIVDIAALTCGIVAVSETGKVYVYGRTTSGLCDKDYDTKTSELIYQKSLENIVAVDGSDYCVLAVSRSGDLYAWGLDTNAQIYQPNSGEAREAYELVSQPTKLHYNDIVQFSMGVLNGTAIDAGGKLYIWGDSSIGQLEPLGDFE